LGHLIEVSKELGFINLEKSNTLLNEIDEIKKMLYSLIRTIKKPL